ncbi:MAG TPA: nitroreductase [Bacteroidales bacterium]|nr:nitroreductase [Bacteroidales bacterium]
MIIEAINKRKSWLAFSERNIEPEKLEAIFEAARLAPSSMNIQPWRFVYANHNEPEFQLILDTLAEGNKRWARDAATLVLSIAQTEYMHNDKLYKNAYAWHDTGMANILLMVQAAELGIESHPMGGFDHLKASQNFNLPKEYESVLTIALGYRGDENSLPEDSLKRQNAPRKRKPIEEVAFKRSIK